VEKLLILVCLVEEFPTLVSQVPRHEACDVLDPGQGLLGMQGLLQLRSASFSVGPYFACACDASHIGGPREISTVARTWLTLDGLVLLYLYAFDFNNVARLLEQKYPVMVL
jgi:hypothetical protein